MKTAGVRELRDLATSCLSGSSPVAVTKHGHVRGGAGGLFAAPPTWERSSTRRFGDGRNRVFVEWGPDLIEKGWTDADAG